MVNSKRANDNNGEWFELYNDSPAPVNIRNWKVVGAPSSQNFLINPPTTTPTIVPANSYYVLAVDGDFSDNGGVVENFEYDNSFQLSNSADSIILFRADGTMEQDRVEYTSSWPFGDGRSMQLRLPGLNNNAAASWCQSTKAWYGPLPEASKDYGTPGALNDC